jgi:ATP-dependent Clp protease ATP-binding subunit ClpA
MFERFTVQARGVVANAQGEAERLRHSYIGTEHLLLALLDSGSGATSVLLHDAGLTREGVTADIGRLLGAPSDSLGEDDAAALHEIGIDLDAVRAKVEEVFGPGALQPPEPEPRWSLLGRKQYGTYRFTARTKKVIELSLREAIALRHNFIGAEHILLGLLRDNAGVAAKVLAAAGVDVDALRRKAVASLDKAA